MAENDLLWIGLVGIGLGIFLFIAGFISLKKKRLIENIPTSKIRSIAMGLVEINGETVPAQKKVLKSPFSNKDCVYYDYTVEQYTRSGKRSRWVTIRRGTDSIPFYLKDKTGSVLVEPKGADIDIPMDYQFNSAMGNDPPIKVKNFLRKINLKFEGLWGINHRMRYREYFIAPKDTLYILGTAGDNPYVKEATAQKGVEDVMIQKGKNEKFYYISDKHESNILKSLKWKVFGGIFGGAALSVGGLIVILIYFGLLL